MTTTTAISAQTIGTSTNVGNGKFPQKVTLTAGTTAFVLSALLLNGTDAYSRSNEVRIWYSTSSFSISAAAAVLQLRQTARYLDVRPSINPGETLIIDSTFEPITGAYLYLWCDIPTVTTAQTLTVNVVELP